MGMQTKFSPNLPSMAISGDSRAYQIYTSCIMDTSDPRITFDDDGVCDYCTNFENEIVPSWHIDARGQADLLRISRKI